jgi:two-component system sensor histidine kinase YesM
MKGKSLKFRLLAVFLPVSAVGVLFLALISEKSIKALIQRHTSERAIQMLEYYEHSIQYNVMQWFNTASRIDHDLDLQSLFSDLFHETAGYDTTFQIRRRLDGFFNYSDRIFSVIFFFRNGQMFNYLMIPNSPAEEIRKMPWYSKFLADDTNIHILSRSDRIPFDNYSGYLFSMVYRPRPPYQDTGVELMYIALFDETFESVYSGSGGQITILDAEGYVIDNINRSDEDNYFHSLFKSGYFKNSYGDFRRGADHRVFYYYKSELTGWTLVYSTDSSIVDKGVNRITLMIIILSFGVIFLSYSITYYLVGSLTRPLEQLTMRMSSFRGRKADFIVQNIPRDESRQLELLFQQMEDEIGTLIGEIEELERARSSAQIAALQYQINPHFILNTLNAIRNLVITTGGDQRVNTMMLSFSRMINGCLSDISDTQSLKNEREYLTSYLQIMRLRYNAQWSTEFEIPPDLEEALILKFLLQPLVENCVLHGLSANPAGGVIKISAGTDGGILHITILDNGTGIPPDILDDIMNGRTQKTAGFSHVGIYNISQRIKLNYSPDAYGINIMSSSGGTRITLALPLLFYREGMQ